MNTDTLKLTRAERLALDREFVDRLQAHGKPATVAEMLGGTPEPKWATEAADRLVIAGVLVMNGEGRVWPVALLGKTA